VKTYPPNFTNFVLIAAPTFFHARLRPQKYLPPLFLHQVHHPKTRICSTHKHRSLLTCQQHFQPSSSIETPSLRVFAPFIYQILRHFPDVIMESTTDPRATAASPVVIVFEGHVKCMCCLITYLEIVYLTPSS